MTTAYSKITTKAQTVIPREVRSRLGLKAGDRVRYRMTPKGVLLEKAEAEGDDPFATFAEWSSEADERAYKSL
ncbi:MAG TPA: type II toxin-antitoxin system PrlF family antitoxin [Rhizomicrobium sp.]|jgi:antitoxin PrlF|nr:type II toxin-antitoxin system PrlF family antitoxin [Rhizomicrobium sp.]